MEDLFFKHLQSFSKKAIVTTAKYELFQYNMATENIEDKASSLSRSDLVAAMP